MAGNIVVGILRALLTLDTAEYTEGVRKATKDTNQFGKDLTAFGKQTAALGTAMLPVTAGIVGLGAGILASGSNFDAALKSIRASTGATGDDLAGLGESFRVAFRGGAEGAAVVADALSELHKRTGSTGQPLEQLTRQMLDLADISRTEVRPLVADTTRLFGDWSIETARQSGALDLLWKTSQNTGIGVDSLAQKLVQFGAPLRTMGFSFEESAALMGKWEKEGVNLELVLGSLRIAAGKFAKENIPMREGLEAVIQRIQELGPGAEATGIAMEVFGRRAGADMADAILQGRFAIDQIVTAIANSSDTIAAADAQTEDLAEKWGTVKNQILDALAPVGLQMVKALESLIPAITSVAEKLATVTTWFAELDPSIQIAVGGTLAFVAAVGPLLVAIGTLISSVGIAIPLLKALGPALGAAFGPIGLIATGLQVALIVWQKWGDDITRIAAELYTNIKTWLNDKLFAVFNAIKVPIDKTKALFRDLYEAVVGHSYVKDTVEGTGDYFARLEGLMVPATKKATEGATAAFKKMTEQIKAEQERLLAIQQRAFGVDTVRDVQSYIHAIGGISGITKLSADETKAFATRLDEAINTSKRLGLTTLTTEFTAVRQAIALTSSQVSTLSAQYAVNTGAMQEAAMATRDLDREGRLLASDMVNIELAMEKTAQATKILNEDISKTPSLFVKLRDVGIEMIGGLNQIFQAAFTGGGGVIGAIKSFATSATESILGMIPVVGPVISQFAGTIVAMFSKLFGGPSAKELAGREVVAEFEANISRMLTNEQRIEAGNEAWKRTVVVVRDAYLALGRTEAEALAAVQALWASSKGGAEAVRAAITPIQDALDQVKDHGQSAAEDLRWSFQQTTDAIQDMKDQIAEPITVRVEWDVEHPQSTRGGDVAFARGASSDDVRRTVERFLQDNPGDVHRIGSATGLSVEQLHQAGVPGFATGTPGLRAVDFGAGTLAMLHGTEHVVPSERVGDFVERQSTSTALIREVNALRSDLARRDQELTRMNQLLPTMVATAVRDHLQLGSRRS